MNKFCVLMTATIDPQGMTLTRRTNPKDRENDYIEAIRNLTQQVQLPIVVVENSGYDPTNIIRTLEDSAKSGFEFFQIDGQNFPKRLGKGYGEMNCLSHAVLNSKLIKNSECVIKITGRYTVLNLKDLMDSLEGQRYIVAADYFEDKRYTMSGIFFFTTFFFLKYLLPLKDKIDDSRKQPMEMVLKLAIDNARKDGQPWQGFMERPQISGYSGTWNAKIKRDNYFDVEMSMGKIVIIVRKLRQRFKRRAELLINFFKNHES